MTHQKLMIYSINYAPIPSKNLPMNERLLQEHNDTDRFSRVHTFLTKQPEDKGSKDCWKQTWEDLVQDVLEVNHLFTDWQIYKKFQS